MDKDFEKIIDEFNSNFKEPPGNTPKSCSDCKYYVIPHHCGYYPGELKSTLQRGATSCHKGERKNNG